MVRYRRDAKQLRLPRRYVKSAMDLLVQKKQSAGQENAAQKRGNIPRKGTNAPKYVYGI